MNNLVVLLVVQIIVSIFLIVWVRQKVTRSLDDGDSIARVRREIGALIIELDGSADRNITVIEDRLRELKECVAEADKRIVMLSSEKARTWGMPPVTLQQTTQGLQAQAGDQQAAVRDQQAPAGNQQAAVRDQQAPAGNQQAQAGHQQAPVRDQQAQAGDQQAQAGDQLLAAGMQTAAQTSVDRLDRVTVADSGLTGRAGTTPIPFIRFSDKPLVFEEPFADRVARLHKRGFSSDIIAAKLKATIAEVDLAIHAGRNPAEGREES